MFCASVVYLLLQGDFTTEIRSTRGSRVSFVSYTTRVLIGVIRVDLRLMRLSQLQLEKHPDINQVKDRAEYSQHQNQETARREATIAQDPK